MKKIAALLLTAVMMLTFSSCASTELELKNRIIVEAIGIDYCDIGVRVTVQFLNADQSSNPNNGGTPDDIVKNMTIDSQNISSAIQSISKTLGKLPMMSQNRVIIFGNEAAKAGVGKALDYFVRNSDNRATVYAAVAEDTAGQILRAEMGQRVIPAKELSNVLSSSKYNSVTAERAFYQFVNGVTGKTSSAFLPIIAIEQNKKDDDGGEDGRNDSARPVVRGAALFNGGKMENVLPQDNVPALLMLCNDFNNGSLTAVLDDGTRVGVLLTKSKTKIKTSVKNGCPSFDISVDCVADCTETSKIMNEAFTPEVAENIKTALEKAVRRNIDDTVKKCFTEFNKDPFGFDKRVKRADAEYYRAESDNWKSVLQKAGYSVTVNVKLRRAGDENMVPGS